jgi:hypothetical protein
MTIFFLRLLLLEEEAGMSSSMHGCRLGVTSSVAAYDSFPSTLSHRLLIFLCGAESRFRFNDCNHLACLRKLGLFILYANAWQA